MSCGRWNERTYVDRMKGSPEADAEHGMAKLQTGTISNRMVAALRVERDTMIWDRELMGFGVLAYPSGCHVYVAQAVADRPNGATHVRVYRATHRRCSGVSDGVIISLFSLLWQRVGFGARAWARGPRDREFAKRVTVGRHGVLNANDARR